MLSYNDAYHQPTSQQSEATCVVCHDLTPSERIIWKRLSFQPQHYVYYDSAYDGQAEALVPICVDCADLFHDVKR